MGKRKRKSNKAPRKKKQEKLNTLFSCPFCNHDASVDCKLDRKNNIGETKCQTCQEGFGSTINALSEPIDVYSEWIDECEQANICG